MAKIVLKFDKPELISAEPIPADVEQFIQEILAEVKVKPQFIFFGTNVNIVQKDTVYINCNFTCKTVVDEGITKNIPVHDIIYQNNGTTPNGSITISDGKNTLFAYYEELNSIAICDFFMPTLNDLNSANSGRIDRAKKTIALLKVILKFSKKTYTNFEAQRQTEQEIQSELDKICIGSDPEFSIIRKNDDSNFVNAQNITKTKEDFKIGADGHASILELRPNHSNNIECFLQNIDKIVMEASELIDDSEHDIISGGGKWADESLGGHVHFSGITHSKDLVDILDVFIGRPLKNCSGGKRPAGGRQNYDLDGQIRVKTYGFEYRTPPSFFGNEKLAKSTYVVAYLLAKTIKRCQKMGLDFAYDTTLVKSNYTQLFDYEKYKDYVDYFFEHTSNKLGIDGKVFSNWNIADKKSKDIKKIPIISSEEKYIAEIIPDSVQLWKPPFKSVKFYGIAHSNAPLHLINIDSLFISYNVNTGIIQKWLADHLSQVCIVDYYTSIDNVKAFVEKGQLSIGLSKSIREYLLKIDAVKREILLKKLLQRISIFVRDSVENIDYNLLEDELEKAEFQTISKLIN